MSSLHGIDDLMKRLGKIEQEFCVGEIIAEAETPMEKDDFIRTKTEMYNLLTLIKSGIRERHEIHAKNGNCHEAIKKGHDLSVKLNSIEELLKKLQNAYKKQVTRKKVKQAELDLRWQDIQVLRKHIMEARATFRNSSNYTMNEIRTLTDIRADKEECGGETWRRTPGQKPEEPSEEDLKQVAKWKQRDAGFDKDLDEIKDGVAVLEELAVGIGRTADTHAKMIEEISKDNNKATTKLATLNVKTRNVMKTQKNSTFMCRIIAIIVLVACGGFIWAQVKGSL
eukprot:GHVL01008334.1.p1 GENE.GHVL01008334.1~~GHVL01008334.1.p1  ORF type:complete len:282 (+),score=50.42 GHVL01008334.1:42-887(+)